MLLEQLLGAAVSFVSAIVIASAPAPVAEPTPPKPEELIRLEEFLSDKKSPIPAGMLYSHPNWKAILSVANAESGYGRFMAGTYNAWGINDYRSGSKRFGRPRNFESWEESLTYTSKLLFKYDTEDGMPAPWDMVATWKYVKPYDHWVYNVSYSLRDIERNTQVDLAVSTEEESLL